ncbi:MAG: maltotransferase domain-containing protein [Dehalococcoidia bacterium]
MPPETASKKALDTRRRVVIENVQPEIDCGRYPAKGVLGDDVMVEADIFADGHDAVSAVLLHRYCGDENARDWVETPFEPLINDRWSASFCADKLGCYEFTVEGWADHFKTWRRDMAKRVDAGQEVAVDLMIGADLLDDTARRAPAKVRRQLKEWAATLRSGESDEKTVKLALADEVAAAVAQYPDRTYATRYGREPSILVDPVKAQFSSWYEMFPRSTAAEPGRHGTFRDCELRLPYIAKMGFDVLYLPPIHPIGHTARKGPNNWPVARDEDYGSPWAIGSELGGHKAIHPELGTIEDFRHLVQAASEYGIDIALDIAFQCSPDHPYVKEHPEWFRKRPDGTIQYAENPPKKYQDIYPFDFESEAREELCRELTSVVLYWADQGVRIFRVDNPHTKSFSFWERLIGDVKAKYPEAIFLSEAFTRPKVMYRLAKLGFTQSYTYFAWRQTKGELTEYFTELSEAPAVDFFRPNLWPNTPDILTEQLQTGGRPAFMARLVLAATLGASYGIYGPPFELMEHVPREVGSEEYLDSEKYEVRHWELESEDSLSNFVARVNQIRRENAALHSIRNLIFHETDNEHIICYSKQTADGSSTVLVVVNLDHQNTQHGWIDLRLRDLGLDPDSPFQVHDLLTGARYAWQGYWNYVELNPRMVPAHIFRVRKRVPSEQGIDQFA